jgi:hypothetical protein
MLIRENAMNFKNISLFLLLFAASCVGTSIFGSDELTAILNEKEGQWSIADNRRLSIVDTKNLCSELQKKLLKHCHMRDFFEYGYDNGCTDFTFSLFKLGAALNQEILKLQDEQDRLKDDIDALKDEIMSK